MANFWETARQASLDRKTKRQQDRINSTKGTGRYRYRNSTASQIGLPKPSDEGKCWISAGETFTGDSYFQRLGGITMIEVIDDGSPKIEVAAAPVLETPAAEPEPAKVKVATEAQARVEVTVRPAEPMQEETKPPAPAKEGIKRPKPQLRMPQPSKDTAGDSSQN